MKNRILSIVKTTALVALSAAGIFSQIGCQKSLQEQCQGQPQACLAYGQMFTGAGQQGMIVPTQVTSAAPSVLPLVTGINPTGAPGVAPIAGTIAQVAPAAPSTTGAPAIIPVKASRDASDSEIRAQAAAVAAGMESTSRIIESDDGLISGTASNTASQTATIESTLPSAGGTPRLPAGVPAIAAPVGGGGIAEGTGDVTR